MIKYLFIDETKKINFNYLFFPGTIYDIESGGYVDEKFNEIFNNETYIEPLCISCCYEK